MTMSDGNFLYKWVLAISSVRNHKTIEALSMAKWKFSGSEDEEPLLLSRAHIKSKKVGALVPFLKWVLRISMWVIFVAWATLLFVFPAEFAGGLIEKLAKQVSGTLFGSTGSLFLIFSGPILLIAVLAIIHVFLSGEEEEEELQVKKGRTSPRLRLWTLPVLVDGPFGVVVAAEFIGICIFGVYVLWALYAYTLRNLKLLSEFDLTSLVKSSLFLELTGLRLGSIGMFCLAFLFLPISRGSVLLRFIDIPFEQATRYHVWLGHLTMWLFTLHGLCYVVAYAMQGRLLQEIFAWASVGVAVLPGVISLLAGLLMWVTSLAPVRKKQFELFFYTHQLYIIFIVFYALHVGDFIFGISSAGIFLFMLDRFLRFCQSRWIVKVVSATSLPGGTVELVFSKPSNLNYNALSFIFIQIRELSWLQWHPFSVSSSPLDGKNHISVLVKVLGEWTAKLRGNIEDTAGPGGETEQPSATLTASVEGPYGHESPYHLTYENLILVAGGIGVSPFFAILSDILHRKSEGKPCLPKNVVLVWAVKKSDELPLLSTLNMDAICPVAPDNLNLDIRIYVTREFEPPLEEGSVEKTMDSHVFPISTSNSSAMSVLVGTGNTIWSGLYVIATIVGFVVLIALVDIFYINPYGIKSWWYKGLIFITCMTVSVPLFGGLVIGLWHLWGKRIAAAEDFEGSKAKPSNEAAMLDNLSERRPVASKRITYGSRPDFGEIFGSLSEQWGHVDVGVIVCGPVTLQTSVAKECRSRSLKKGPGNTIFHFNSHSFDL